MFWKDEAIKALETEHIADLKIKEDEENYLVLEDRYFRGYLVFKNYSSAKKLVIEKFGDVENRFYGLSGLAQYDGRVHKTDGFIWMRVQ